MKLRRSMSSAMVIALAVLGARPAFADDANAIAVTTASAGSATVNVMQTVALPSETANAANATNVAAINAPFTGLSGSGGMNVASGTLNAQSNVIVMSTVALSNVTATVSQRTGFSGNGGTGSLLRSAGSNTATIGGSAFMGSTGAIAMNVAAGVGNLQSNVIIAGH